MDSLGFCWMEAIFVQILINEPVQHPNISNHPCFRQKHPGVPDSSYGANATWYPLTEDYTLVIAQPIGRVEYLPPLLCARNVVTYTCHRNATFVTLIAGATVMLWLFRQRLAMLMPFSGGVPHITSPLLLYFRCRTLPIYV